MKGQLAVALMVGLVLGLALPAFVSQHEAQGQRVEKAPTPAQWEYKVVALTRGSDHAKQLNELAADGWEYVGLLVNHSGTGLAVTVGDVAFRRPKK